MSRNNDRWCERVCHVCGKTFLARGHNAKYCLECGMLRKKGNVPVVFCPGQPKKPIMSLTECAAKAKELGMTYGEYVLKSGSGAVT